MLQGVGTQPLQTYLDRSQAAVAEWVALRPIFDVCVMGTGYEVGGVSRGLGGGRRQRRKYEVHVKRYFDRGKGASATGIRQAWRG